MGGELSAPVVDDDSFLGLPRLSAGVGVDDPLGTVAIALECSSETCLRNSISFENTLLTIKGRESVSVFNPHRKVRFKIGRLDHLPCALQVCGQACVMTPKPLMSWRAEG